MASTPEATASAPSGFLAFINAKASRLGIGRADLLRRAGVSEDEDDSLAKALTGADGEVWRRLFNVLRSQPLICEQVVAVAVGPGDVVTAASYGQQHATVFGDLR